MTREEAIINLKLSQNRIGGMKKEEWNALQMAIESLQTELVRCKDCRWYSVKGKTTMYGWCDANWISVNEIDYCSKGERKGGDSE